MPFNRIQRRFTAWLAMLALGLGALAPALAQAVVSTSDRSDWVQICNASGMMWIQADAAVSGTDSVPQADMGSPCAWCLMHSPVAGLPPAPVMGFTSSLPQPLPGGCMAAAPPVGVWTAAPARAPPAFS
jgi:hypothetical protein